MATTTNTCSDTVTLCSLVKTFIDLINQLIPVLAGFALLLFLWGCVKYIYHSSETKGRTEGKQAIIWGIIALFVLFSIWGILNLLETALLPSGSGATGTVNIGAY